MADDEEEIFGGEYEDGHWVWDESIEGLQFVSDLPEKHVEVHTVQAKAPTGAIEFRDDVDLIEQIRYRRRYQRKVIAGQPDVITVQDLKDIAIFTAPINILSPMLINMLHLATTERFIRALILYCQYYLQISDEMANRMIQLATKVRTPDCEILENEYRDNLADLRLLVAKEYSIMLLGGADTKKFHHMGPQKKRQSLSNKDARLFETMLRMCVQVVWLALGRSCFNQIELEVNRIFKSDIFNAVEHTLHTDFINKMATEERVVLLGQCVRQDQKLITRSPLINEVFCHRPIDYRLMGLGVIKYSELTPRLRYMLAAVAGPEEDLIKHRVTVGILGQLRSHFDTMLVPLPAAALEDSKSKSRASMSKSHTPSSDSSKKSQMLIQKLYPDIELPPIEDTRPKFPESFPDIPDEIRPCSEIQRCRWQNRLLRLLYPHRFELQTKKSRKSNVGMLAK